MSLKICSQLKKKFQKSNLTKFILLLKSRGCFNVLEPSEPAPRCHYERAKNWRKDILLWGRLKFYLNCLIWIRNSSLVKITYSPAILQTRLLPWEERSKKFIKYSLCSFCNFFSFLLYFQMFQHLFCAVLNKHALAISILIIIILILLKKKIRSNEMWSILQQTDTKPLRSDM